MNLSQSFTESARNHAEKTAIFWGEQKLSYQNVFNLSQWMARRLRAEFGLQSGDRVGLWLKNCPEFVHSLFGILQADGVVVSINNFLKPEEVTYILKDSGAEILISEAAMAEDIAILHQEIPELRSIQVEEFGEADLDAETEVPLAERRESDLAVIIYTSGTTGKPKGAMLSHGNLLSNVESTRIELAAVEVDRFAVLLPMFHSFMMTACVLLPMLTGSTIVVIKSLHPPKNILREIIQNGATILPAIPQLFRTLANAQLPPNLPLRVCVSGAAPLPVEVLREFESKVGIPLVEGYGLSEASPVVALNPLNGEHKAGSIGLPVTGVEVQIRNDTGEELPVGEAGELCVRGRNVMMGYWNKPEATAETIRDGWLLTGDIGHKDADGYIYITDRKKDMLLVNGINVYPREIEEVIYQFEGVKEASVVGVEDAKKGEQPVAFVAVNEGATVEDRELVEFLKGKLANYKVPRKIIQMEALPRNATGKILKIKLREIAGEQFNR